MLNNLYACSDQSRYNTGRGVTCASHGFHGLFHWTINGRLNPLPIGYIILFPFYQKITCGIFMFICPVNQLRYPIFFMQNKTSCIKWMRGLFIRQKSQSSDSLSIVNFIFAARIIRCFPKYLLWNRFTGFSRGLLTGTIFSGEASAFSRLRRMFSSSIRGISIFLGLLNSKNILVSKVIKIFHGLRSHSLYPRLKFLIISFPHTKPHPVHLPCQDHRERL